MFYVFRTSCWKGKIHAKYPIQRAFVECFCLLCRVNKKSSSKKPTTSSAAKLLSRGTRATLAEPSDDNDDENNDDDEKNDNNDNNDNAADDDDKKQGKRKKRKTILVSTSSSSSSLSAAADADAVDATKENAALDGEELKPVKEPSSAAAATDALLNASNELRSVKRVAEGLRPIVSSNMSTCSSTASSGRKQTVAKETKRTARISTPVASNAIPSKRAKSNEERTTLAPSTKTTTATTTKTATTEKPSEKKARRRRLSSSSSSSSAASSSSYSAVSLTNSMSSSASFVSPSKQQRLAPKAEPTQTTPQLTHNSSVQNNRLYASNESSDAKNAKNAKNAKKTNNDKKGTTATLTSGPQKYRLRIIEDVEETIEKNGLHPKQQQRLQHKTTEDFETDEEEDEQAQTIDECFYSESNTTASASFANSYDDVVITDVTSGVVTVTIKECVSPDGFFRKRCSIWTRLLLSFPETIDAAFFF